MNKELIELLKDISFIICMFVSLIVLLIFAALLSQCLMFSNAHFSAHIVQSPHFKFSVLCM